MKYRTLICPDRKMDTHSVECWTLSLVGEDLVELLLIAIRELGEIELLFHNDGIGDASSN
jgi:hypothetical protein